MTNKDAIEKKMKHFFFLRFLFIWADISFYMLMISQWFKTKVRSWFCHQWLLKMLKVRGKKNMISRKQHDFKREKLKKYEIKIKWSESEVKEISLKSCQYSRNYTTLL